MSMIPLVISMIVAVVLAAHGEALKVQQPCQGVPKNMMVPKNCDNCCESEGFVPGTAFFWQNKCRCGTPTKARRLQEYLLEKSTNEFDCNHIRGMSHDALADGTPLEVACDRCCQEKSYRFGHYRIDHSIGSNGSSQCQCDVLVLKYVPPKEH